MKFPALRLALAALLLFAGLSQAQVEDTSVAFGPYTVHYSVFHSSFVPADIASLHGLTRAKDQALINIAVQDTASGQSVPARVTGHARNLMQQQKAISFKTISEPDASYAIGSLRHGNEEVFHFTLQVAPEGADQAYELNFTRKLYRD